MTKADNTAQLTGLAEKASSEGLPHYIVHDAGKTQVKVILYTYKLVMRAIASLWFPEM